MCFCVWFRMSNIDSSGDVIMKVVSRRLALFGVVAAIVVASVVVEHSMTMAQPGCYEACGWGNGPTCHGWVVVGQSGCISAGNNSYFQLVGSWNGNKCEGEGDEGWICENRYYSPPTIPIICGTVTGPYVGNTTCSIPPGGPSPGSILAAGDTCFTYPG
jgi:hypothetical protein